MIPRPQHFGDRATFPVNWSGVVRIFEKPLIEALLLSAGGRAHYPGEQSYASIEDDHRAKLAPGENIVADADRLQVARVEDPLVETLEPSGEKNDAFAGGKVAHARLGQRSAARRKGQHRTTVGDAVQRRRDHVRA